MEFEEVINKIESLYNEKNVKSLTRYGIKVENAYGLSAPVLKKMAKEIGRDHKIALKLWDSGIHDARLLACLIENPEEATEQQIEKWVSDLNSWALCDCFCVYFLLNTSFAYKKIMDWKDRDEEFVKRAAFTLIAVLGVHDKKAENKVFLNFLPVIREASGDDRNFVKKAVNWALRQIGKRNPDLNQAAIQCAEEMKLYGSKPAKWIANDALRELKREKIQNRLQKRLNKNQK